MQEWRAGRGKKGRLTADVRLYEGATSVEEKGIPELDNDELWRGLTSREKNIPASKEGTLTKISR